MTTTSRRRIACMVAVLAPAFGIVASIGSASTPTTASQGRQLYRQFCGKCHALSVALAAGFGSSSSKGLGDLGGPSFNEMRVPYVFSVTAVTEPTGGHEVVRTKITKKQLSVVATYIAKVTVHHPVPALPTDG